jgi:hypothetical protein
VRIANSQTELQLFIERAAGDDLIPDDGLE